MSLLKNVTYCTRCTIPSTQEGVTFDELGICTACISSEEKMHINWADREKEFKKILEEAKSKAGNNYDCVLPISGGKDSFFQAHVLTKVYDMKPLAVTFSHNWYSETGFYNLQKCLEVFNLDHMQFTPARGLVNKLARKSIDVIGDSCWHCHAGIGSFPLQIATKFKIPLLVWGESIAENDGREGHGCAKTKFDRDYFTKVSARLTAEEMVDKNLSSKDMHPFSLPSYEEIDDTGVFGVHMGDYIFWDDEKQTEWIRDTYGWAETEIEGTYKGYKSAECIMSGMHDFTCYLKRGFGRATIQTAMDVRNGLLTREEGFKLLEKHDQEIPEALNYYLQITELTDERFFEILNDKKLKELHGVELKMRKKSHKNAEMIKPFVQQVIDKYQRRVDPRIKKK